MQYMLLQLRIEDNIELFDRFYCIVVMSSDYSTLHNLTDYGWRCFSNDLFDKSLCKLINIFIVEIDASHL
jgi:hypothetical protein